MSDGKDIGDERVGPTICGKQSVHVVIGAFVNMGDGKNVGDERVGPIIYGKQSVHIGVEAFGAEGDVSTPDQAEEVLVKKNLLQSAPRMFMEVVEAKKERE